MLFFSRRRRAEMPATAGQRAILSRLAWLLVAIVVVWAVYTAIKARLATSTQAEVALAPAPSVPGPADRDQQLRRLVLGRWHDEYQGKRTMVLAEDGTGTMVVELSGMAATLFAPRLQFNMEWSIAEGRLQQHSLGGEPEAKVKAVLAMMGDRVDQPILELTPDRLLLLDKDGKTQYDWRRTETR